MKKTMLGNEALARGLYEAGVKVVSSYPGTPSTEITEFAAKYDEIYCEWAPNEKVALETAFGASLRGVRAACAMKHVGLNVAADPLFTLSYTGVTGGLVLFVADDPAMHSSQNEQDSRHYAIAAKVPMLEPADSAEAKDYVKEAYRLSEEYDTPVIIRTCTRIAHSQNAVELSDREERALDEYIKRPQKYIMSPANAIKRHPFVEERLKKLADLAERSPLNRVEKGDSEIGIVCAGNCYQYVKEVFGDSASVLKLGMVNPLPEKLFRDFAASVKKLYVIEELDGIIEGHIKALGIDCIGKALFPAVGELNQTEIKKAFGLPVPEYVTVDTPIPPRPPVMCAGCPHRGLYYVLSKHKITALGDIGCYTLGGSAPLFALDSTLCMGASVSGLHGFNKAGGGESEKKTVCVIGDSTFIHSGITGLVNIAYNGSSSTVIILDNSITGMTGHQQNPTTGYNIKGEPANAVDLEELCKAVGIKRVKVVDPYHIKECEEAVLEELAVDEPSVIISRRPCVLLKYVKAKAPLNVDESRCVGCKACMRLGCPAISFADGHARIDRSQCIGCGVCQELCKPGAIKE
ncbi:MAG: indolepyruvate ferredoxin oxidoreductase subunit alpha [Bacteroides sp.]|nr:indolepyruvate ferredoxin oxidoreductase subunit alpha [Eubacterium sp.]MCM1418651.1 indolepyruvate ferredoxin oxidoreductase subunit alpha [Roseburia sp.]MCM1462705.1 indolepyruvate ferredoxin oxidoreductase subunit alpha [Bacteroides sp.]